MKNFYLVYGLDKSVIDNEVNHIIKKINVDDVIRYYGSDLNVLSVLEDASTVSMFSNKKIIVVDNCLFLKANKTVENLEILEGYIEHYNPDTYIIFICVTDKVDSRKKIVKLIKSKGSVIECKSGDINYLKNYVSDYLIINGYKMNDINYFLNKYPRLFYFL